MKLTTFSFGLATSFGIVSLLAAPVRAAEATNATVDVSAPAFSKVETAAFKTLAQETMAALDAGKTSEMVAKLTDLETAWDDKEEVLSPKDTTTWTSLDKTLDKAISALRSSRVSIPKGRAALEELLKKLDAATKH